MINGHSAAVLRFSDCNLFYRLTKNNKYIFYLKKKIKITIKCKYVDSKNVFDKNTI